MAKVRGLAVAKGNPNTLAAYLRREVEARTGAIANMAQLGFRPVKYNMVGEVTRWTTHQKFDSLLSVGWVIQRTQKKTWRVIYLPGRPMFVKNAPVHGVPAEVRVGDGITFGGPVAAACWLAAEKSNGNGTR